MTLNSRTATLNGKKFTLPSAPRKIRYIAKKKNYIMVPGDIVAKTRLKLFMEQSSVIRSDLKGSTNKPAPSTPSNTNLRLPILLEVQQRSPRLNLIIQSESKT